MAWLEGPTGDDPWSLVLRTVDASLCAAVRDTMQGPNSLRTEAREAANRAANEVTEKAVFEQR